VALGTLDVGIDFHRSKRDRILNKLFVPPSPYGKCCRKDDQDKANNAYESKHNA